MFTDENRNIADKSTWISHSTQREASIAVKEIQQRGFKDNHHRAYPLKSKLYTSTAGEVNGRFGGAMLPESSAGAQEICEIRMTILDE